MMTLNQAIAYGNSIGVKYYVRNDRGCIMGGTKTLEQARKMKKDFEIEDKENPWTKGTTRFYIEQIAPDQK